METYKNSYTEEEDNVLWELHEIRHRLHEAKKKKSIEEINREALKKYADWQKERTNQKNSHAKSVGIHIK